MQVVYKPVTNYTSGRYGYRPEAIVIHIAEGYLQGAYAWFNNASSLASSHYMIGKQGEIWQFVKEEDTSWHAGGINQPSWSKLKSGVNPNFYTIGIEHEGFTGQTWTTEMYKSSAWLLAEISKRYTLPLDSTTVIGHNQINSISRRWCPGLGVDLNKLINLANNLLDDPMIVKQLQEEIKKLQLKNISLVDERKRETEKFIQLQKESQLLKSKTYYLEQKSKEVDTLKKQKRSLEKEVYDLQQNQKKLNAKIIELEDKINNL